MKALSGWVVVALGRRHPEYFIAAIADADEAVATIARHVDDQAVTLKLGSPLNAMQLAARALSTGDIYQVGARRRLRQHPRIEQAL